MEDTQGQNQSAEFMRLAIPLMNKYGIAITPENYAVWYEYVSGRNVQLKEAIDLHISQNDKIGAERTAELYQRFLGSGEEQHNLIELRQELRDLLEHVLGQTTKGVEAASEVTEQMTDTLSKLHPDMPREQINSLLQDVIAETRQFMSSGKQITEKLNLAAQDIEELKTDFEAVRQQAKTDHLTLLDNRHSFEELLSNAVQDADKGGAEVCLIFCDLDLFSQINEKHGHFVGDQVLKVVASTLKGAVKGRDCVARFAGDKFMITLLNTSLANARNLAESIRADVMTKRIQRKDTKEPLGAITMSFGVASYFQSEGVGSFLQRVDRALYQSKKAGRNAVTEAKPPIL